MTSRKTAPATDQTVATIQTPWTTADRDFRHTTMLELADLRSIDPAIPHVRPGGYAYEAIIAWVDKVGAARAGSVLCKRMGVQS